MQEEHKMATEEPVTTELATLLVLLSLLAFNAPLIQIAHAAPGLACGVVAWGDNSYGQSAVPAGLTDVRGDLLRRITT